MAPDKPENTNLLTAKNAVLASVEASTISAPDPLEKALEGARQHLEGGLRGLIEQAKGGEAISPVAQVSAVKKLKIFGSIGNPALATRLALMNNKQRRQFLADKRQAAGRSKVARQRAAMKAAAKEKRRG